MAQFGMKFKFADIRKVIVNYIIVWYKLFKNLILNLPSILPYLSLKVFY